MAANATAVRDNMGRDNINTFNKNIKQAKQSSVAMLDPHYALLP